MVVSSWRTQTLFLSAHRHSPNFRLIALRGGLGVEGEGWGEGGCSPVWANHPQGLPSSSNRSSSSLSPRELVCSSNASSVPSQFRSCCSPAACFARLIQRERWECRKWSDTDRRCSAMTIDRALCIWLVVVVGEWVGGWVL